LLTEILSEEYETLPIPLCDLATEQTGYKLAKNLVSRPNLYRKRPKSELVKNDGRNLIRSEMLTGAAGSNPKDSKQRFPSNKSNAMANAISTGFAFFDHMLSS